MRLQVFFSNPHKEVLLPINNNHTLAAVIKKLIDAKNAADENSGPDMENTLFTFSQLIIPERQIVKDKIAILSDSFHWFIASPDEQFLRMLAESFHETRSIEICGFLFPVDFIKLAETPSFSEGDDLFTCLSPVTVFQYEQPMQLQNTRKTGSKRQYLFPNDDAYYHYLKHELKKKLIRMGILIQENFKFNIKLDQEYLRKKKYRVTKKINIKDENGNDLEVKGFLAPVRIKARPEILQVIYDTGLGQMNEFGFGMLEKVYN